MENNKGLIISIIILSVLVGILLFCWIATAYVYSVSDDEWYYLYEDSEKEWCEIFNDYSEVYNDQLEWLIYYDYEIWEDSEQAEIIDCYI